jgi:hypothetical protein
MIAICPAGPPKFINPSFTQNQNASLKLTDLVLASLVLTALVSISTFYTDLLYKGDRVTMVTPVVKRWPKIAGSYKIIEAQFMGNPFSGSPVSENEPSRQFTSLHKPAGRSMGKRRSQPCSCGFHVHPGHTIVMHSGVQEREAMRRKLLVLFVALASVFGMVACGGEVEVEERAEEEAEEAQQEVQEAKEEEKEAEKEREEAQEELKEAEKAAEEEEQQEEELKK